MSILELGGVCVGGGGWAPMHACMGGGIRGVCYI